MDNRIIRPPASYSSYDAERKEATVEHRKRLSRFNTTPLASGSSIQALPKKKLFLPAFSYWVFIILVTFAALYSPVPASATANGISGFSGKTGSTCTPCHSNGTAPTVTLTGPTSVASGSTNTYTFMVGGSGNGGLDVAPRRVRLRPELAQRYSAARLCTILQARRIVGPLAGTPLRSQPPQPPRCSGPRLTATVAARARSSKRSR